MKRDKKLSIRDVEAAAALTTTTAPHQQSSIINKQQEQLLQNSTKQAIQNNSDKHTMLSQQVDHQNASDAKERHKVTCCCFRANCLSLISMTIIAIIITAILVAMLTITYLDNEDQCFNNFPFQQPSYKLFATKTTYSSAYTLLNDSKLRYDKSSKEVPNVFSKSDSLRTLNEQLVFRDNCKVRQLHYFGRHAARYPSSKGILEINELLTSVQNRIDLSKFSINNNNNKSTNNPTDNKNSSASVCFNPLAQYKQWMPIFASEQGNLIMDSGFDETTAIAQRFKSIFPDMFNASRTKIDLGTTEELRTAQTALPFLKQLDNFSLDVCNLDQFPATDRSVRPDEVTSNECLKALLRKYQKDKLQFHKRCESLHKEDYTVPLKLNLKEPNRTKSIAVSVSKKLKLAKEDYLSTEETEALQKICKFESALSGTSIWCNLFSDDDLKFYEYLSDVDDFFNQAYGHPDQMRSACPVTTDLMRSFKTARVQDPSRTQPEAHFYFTHSEVIQKILAASIDLEQDPDYSPKNILAHFQAGTSPKTRQWRTSLFTPFSANLAFILYECPKASNKPLRTTDEYMEIDVSDRLLKVVTSLNEQPILLDGCSDYACDLSELVTDSRIDREKRCKLEDICRKNIVVT